MVHDAGPHRRVRRRRVRLRGRPAWQRARRQRGGHRPRRARARPTARPRSTSACSRRRAARTRSASRVARCCRRRSAATSSATTGHGQRARRPAGRPGTRARPRRRVLVAARDPGRDRGEGPADRDRPPARGRPAQGHGQERLATATRAAGRRPRPDRRDPRRPRARRDRDGRRRRRRSIQFGQSLSDKVVGPASSARSSATAARRGSTFVTTWSTS